MNSARDPLVWQKATETRFKKKKVEAQTQDASRKMQDTDAIQKRTQNNIVQFPIIYIRVCKICKVLISNYTCKFFIITHFSF